MSAVMIDSLMFVRLPRLFRILGMLDGVCREHDIYEMRGLMLTADGCMQDVSSSEFYDPLHKDHYHTLEAAAGEGWVARFVLVHRDPDVNEDIARELQEATCVDFYVTDFDGEWQTAVMKIGRCMQHIHT